MGCFHLLNGDCIGRLHWAIATKRKVVPNFLLNSFTPSGFWGSFSNQHLDFSLIFGTGFGQETRVLVCFFQRTKNNLDLGSCFFLKNQNQKLDLEFFWKFSFLKKRTRTKGANQQLTVDFDWGYIRTRLELGLIFIIAQIDI